ncbi:6-phosphogluconolactonase [Hoyosella altamirensis]|uniref:6-phosphogluconolactonase n=1 Tax=Hoyosella altamirensis TaxID=616997 RepID=A0A839RU92_9ACTN|nr:6-phosphogluconolactonase [Hoyosella altamirensis]MBB3039887.1 6-phosphogluconolactonase [Hoyosella altamirensis]
MNSQHAQHSPEILVFDSSDALASAAAQRLAATIVTAQSDRGVARIALTGGSTGIAVLRALRSVGNPIDWGKVDIFWGDDRFLPAGHKDRNDAQADEALLSHVPVDAARVYRMPCDEGDFAGDVTAGARAYEEKLRSLTPDGNIPQLDVHLLGMGPDGHINSLFPGKATLAERERAVIAEFDSPKPPLQRITLTYPVVNSSREVWFLVAGADKAPAVAKAVGRASPADYPAAGAQGRDGTTWFLDKNAAELLR